MTVALAQTALVSSGQWSRTGLDLPDGLPLEEWISLGDRLRSIEQSVWWWIGDWLQFGERRYGEMYAQAIEATGCTYSQLTDAKYLAKAYPGSERLENLSWGHHYVAAKLPLTERREILSAAVVNGWSIRDLRVEMVRRTVGAPPPGQAAAVEPWTPGQSAKRTHRVVLAAFCDWFGIGEEYGRVLMALYQGSGKSMDWKDISRSVSTHAPMARGALHEAISSLREVMESESIDRDDSGYWLSEIGQSECRKAFREMGAQLSGLGIEPANDLSPLRDAPQAAN